MIEVRVAKVTLPESLSERLRLCAQGWRMDADARGLSGVPLHSGRAREWRLERARQLESLADAK